MTRIQRLEDGRADPLGRGVTDGFAIVVKDRGGQDTAWADQIFPTEDAANITAARCVPAATDIRPARLISYFGVTTGPSRKHRYKIIID